MAGDLSAGRALYAVVPAGGSGTRLWPVSRSTNPKFLHALTGSAASLLQATVTRLAPLATPEQTFVVTGLAHAAAVARQLPDLPEANLLVEPSPRDSCAAIGLAATLIARRDPDAVMGSFAADHLIGDTADYVRTIEAAVAGAERGLLMTVGITPTHPETAFGYLRCGHATEDDGALPVLEFKEKPSPELAEKYFTSGDYLWNAGMFVWRVDVFLAELHRQQPALHNGLATIVDAWGTDRRDDVLTEVWPELPRLSVDHAVMEGAAATGLVATVPGNFGWTDVGDFDALGDVLASTESGEAGNVIVAEPKDAPALLMDTSRSIVVGQSGRLIATLGVDGLVIVDTPDALLICARDRAQDIKAIVDELKSRGEDRFL